MMQAIGGNGMKILKIIFGSLCFVFALFTVTAPLLSSHMQGYYKGQIDDFSRSAEELLAKKQFWAQIGETYIFFYIFLACVVMLLGIMLFSRLSVSKRSEN